MDYQYFGRQQRPKGTNMKQALLMILLLVVCSWVVYQINHSSNKPDNYGGKPKLVEQFAAVSFGRKGTPSWLSERDFPNSGNVQLVQAKNTNSGKDDESSGNVDERSRKRSESDDKGQGNKKYAQIPVINDSQSNDKEAEVHLRRPPNDVQLQIRKNTRPDGSIKEDEEVEEPETVTDGDWAHSFHDENGVPPEVNETEPIGSSEAHMDMVHEENKSNNSKKRGVRKSNLYDIVEMSLEGSRRKVIADAEINSQRTTAHVDA